MQTLKGGGTDLNTFGEVQHHVTGQVLHVQQQGVETREDF